MSSFYIPLEDYGSSRKYSPVALIQEPMSEYITTYHWLGCGVSSYIYITFFFSNYSFLKIQKHVTSPSRCPNIPFLFWVSRILCLTIISACSRLSWNLLLTCLPYCSVSSESDTVSSAWPEPLYLEQCRAHSDWDNNREVMHWQHA